MSTQTGECIRTEQLDDRAAFPVGVDVEVTTGTVTTTGAGAPQNHLIAPGPMTISGVPTLTADVYTAGADQRVFFGIAVGATPASWRASRSTCRSFRGNQFWGASLGRLSGRCPDVTRAADKGSNVPSPRTGAAHGGSRLAVRG